MARRIRSIMPGLASGSAARRFGSLRHVPGARLDGTRLDWNIGQEKPRPVALEQPQAVAEMAGVERIDCHGGHFLQLANLFVVQLAHFHVVDPYFAWRCEVEPHAQIG